MISNYKLVKIGIYVKIIIIIIIIIIIGKTQLEQVNLGQLFIIYKKFKG